MIQVTAPDSKADQPMKSNRSEDFTQDSSSIAGRSALSHYMGDIARTERFSRQEERTFLLQAQSGNLDARNRMIEANLQLVVSIAKHYTGRGIDLEDLISAGNMGLFTAVKKFDLSKENRFTTYATWWIRQHIQRFVSSYARLITIPTRRAGEIMQVLSVRTTFHQETGEEPTVEDLAERLGQSVTYIQQLLEWSQPLVSLETPSLFQPDHVLSERICTNEGEPCTTLAEDPALLIEQMERQERYARLLNVVLTQREHQVLTCLYGLKEEEPLNMRQTGRQLGITKQRVQQLEVAALEKLRAAFCTLED